MKFLKQSKPETPLAKKAELDEIRDELSQFKVELESKIGESKEETQELITKVADSVENLKIPEELDKDELSESILAKVRVPEALNVEELEENILAKVPVYKEVDEDKLVKKVLKAIPENKASLKIIQEKFEIDPMSVIDKILKMGKKFKLKTENIDGLEQTISSFNNQLKPGVGYLHGGGDTVTAGTNITLVKLPDGKTQINATGGSSFVLTNGSGTTVGVDTTSVDLGGALTADANIDATSDKVFRIRTSTYVNNGLLGVDANTSTAWIGDISGDSRSIFFLADEGNRYLLLNAPTNSIRFNDLSLAGASNGYVWTLTDQSTGEGAWTAISGFVTDVTGTANRITSSGGTTPQIDISASYVGQTSITTLGTVTTGVWNGTLIGVTKGGTGTSTAFSTGSVVFAGASGVYTQDNANFFWDDTNNWLGLGTASPAGKLHAKAGSASDIGIIGQYGSATPTGNAIEIRKSNGTVLSGWNSNDITNLFFGLGAGRMAGTGTSDIFMGYFSGQATTTGSYNVGIGSQTLYTNTTGARNVAIGDSALYTNNSSDNVAIGYNALNLNTSGQYNVGLGSYAGYSNTTGSRNVAIGNQALYSNQTGGDNFALGNNAAQNTTSGNNFAMGYQALYSNVSGTGNTAIGQDSLFGFTGSNNVAIGYFAGFAAGGNSGSNSTYIGVQAGYANTSSSGGNTFIGYYAGGTNTGSFNTFIGDQAGYNSGSGSSNVFIGRVSGYNETGSDKLYIANSSTATPLIWGDFSTASLRFYGNLNVRKTTEQLRLEYDASNYLNFTTDSSGLTTINGAGGTQKALAFASGLYLGFFGVTPIARPTTAIAAATFVTNTSLIANDTATFDGYTIGQVVKALRNAGLLT